MFTLVSGSGAQDYSIGDLAFSNNWKSFRNGVLQLLKARGNFEASEMFESMQFELREGENFFGDEFVVLYTELPIDTYAKLVDKYSEPTSRFEFKQISSALNEICPIDVRFIAIGASLGDGSIAPVAEPHLGITSRTVEEALADARHLISGRGSTSGVDRAHTAFHGYLRELCVNADIEIAEEASVTRLFRALRDSHPSLQADGPRSDDITRLLRALSTVIDTLNPLRNRASLAHPNEQLLDKPEADLTLDSIHTLLHYINSKTT